MHFPAINIRCDDINCRRKDTLNAKKSAVARMAHLTNQCDHRPVNDSNSEKMSGEREEEEEKEKQADADIDDLDCNGPCIELTDE